MTIANCPISKNIATVMVGDVVKTSNNSGTCFFVATKVFKNDDHIVGVEIGNAKEGFHGRGATICSAFDSAEVFARCRKSQNAVDVAVMNAMHGAQQIANRFQMAFDEISAK